MRFLIDIVHPADVLFFRRPISILAEMGHEIQVLSRRKDVTCDLLDEFGIEHTPVSTASSGLFGLGTEMLRRSFATLLKARRFRPNAMLGFGGVSVAHAGSLLDIPSLSFYDTENATLQAKVTWPFISHVYVPSCYLAPTPKGRTTRLAGIKELSYLHPSGFLPDRAVAMQAGLDPSCPNYVVRTVAWRANHDIGKTGWDLELLRKVVALLPGRVHVSSEDPLPDDLEPFRYKGKLSSIHHLMAFCEMFVGESASMAAEAAVLGVPSIYAADFRLGYIDELVGAGLLRQVKADEAMETVAQLLRLDRAKNLELRNAYVDQNPDWGQAVVSAALKWGGKA